LANMFQRGWIHKQVVQLYNPGHNSGMSFLLLFGNPIWQWKYVETPMNKFWINVPLQAHIRWNFQLTYSCCCFFPACIPQDSIDFKHIKHVWHIKFNTSSYSCNGFALKIVETPNGPKRFTVTW
jgi:hypothetical protein